MKKLHNKLILVLALLVGSAVGLQAQPGMVDERARELVKLAKKHFEADDFLEAALKFELATQRPENKLTTYSWYMSGLSFYKLNEKEKATASFSHLVKTWPASNYAHDARFHKALMLLESNKTNDREQGLDQMLRLRDRTTAPNLKDDIESTVRHFLFNV
ncbi:MAG: hypothetical protein AAF570_28825, partial [Bacteroidota bacterium]